MDKQPQNKTKSIHLCTKQHFAAGIFTGIDITDDGIWAADEKKGEYFSPVFDSGERGTVWHRLRIRFQAGAAARLRVSLYASDDSYLSFLRQSRPIADVLAEPNIAIREGFLAKARIHTYDNPPDILLHDIEGRYFWCRFAFLQTECAQINVRSLTVSYPAQTWLDYLPEVYQTRPLSNSFTDQFLSIFQTLYEEIEDKIDHSSALYDADAAPAAFLSRLGGWLGIPALLLWPADKLRDVLRSASRLHRHRGTFTGLGLLIRLYCGADAYFVEAYHVMRYALSSQGEVLRKLYGQNLFSFHILLFVELREGEEQALRFLIEQNKPAHTEARLVLLKPHVLLDGHTYLGINSALSAYGPARLDGQSMLHYSTLGRRNHAV